jgi:hypothetical protein
MAEWNETSPTLDPDGHPVLELGEARIGSLPANGVRFRCRVADVDHRWGPLDMRVVLTTRRIVLIATAVPPDGTPWSTAGSVPIALRAIEPPQRLRGIAPVRIAGHVRWERVTRVRSAGGRVTIIAPATVGAHAVLMLHVPNPLGHRFVAITRAAFVTTKRAITVDSFGRVEAPTADA